MAAPRLGNNRTCKASPKVLKGPLALKQEQKSETRGFGTGRNPPLGKFYLERHRNARACAPPENWLVIPPPILGWTEFHVDSWSAPSESIYFPISRIHTN